MYEIEDKENREQYQMQRSEARKGWIKNLAIVFLMIMLILTFFSNTIMNYSLPQVATQYVQEGNITPKVTWMKYPNTGFFWGSRTTEAFSQEDTKTITDIQSKALEYMTKNCANFITGKSNFQKALFSGNLTNEAVERIRNGEYLTEDEMQERLDSANSSYNEALYDDTEAGLEVERLSGGTDTTGWDEEDIGVSSESGIME